MLTILLCCQELYQRLTLSTHFDYKRRKLWQAAQTNPELRGRLVRYTLARQRRRARQLVHTTQRLNNVIVFTPRSVV